MNNQNSMQREIPGQISHEVGQSEIFEGDAFDLRGGEEGVQHPVVRHMALHHLVQAHPDLLLGRRLDQTHRVLNSTIAKSFPLDFDHSRAIFEVVRVHCKAV